MIFDWGEIDFHMSYDYAYTGWFPNYIWYFFPHEGILSCNFELKDMKRITSWTNKNGEKCVKKIFGQKMEKSIHIHLKGLI